MDDVERQARVLLVSKYYQLASCVVLLYDHILSFDLEVKRVWFQRLTFQGILFYLNRYFPLISYAVIVTAYHQTTWSPTTCRTFLHFPLVMVAISDVIMFAIVITRLYAMYLRDRRVLVLLSALAAVQTALTSWAADSVKLYDGPPHSGCMITVEDGRYYVFGLLWSWSVLFDFTLFILTMRKCLKSRRSSLGMQTPLYDLLMRDGVIYFAAMTITKIVNFVVFWVIARDLITINWTFNHTITVLLVSRIFLNIRAEHCLTVVSMPTSLQAIDGSYPPIELSPSSLDFSTPKSKPFLFF